MTEDPNDDYMGSGIRIQRAIKKYGIENFKKTILFECTSKEEMDKKEAEIVNEDFIARDDVYNIKLGGEGGWDYLNSSGKNTSGNWKSVIEHSRQIKQKTGKWPNEDWLKELKDSNPLQYEEFCQHVSDGLKKSIKENGFWWSGKHHSEESKQKMKDYHAKYHPQAKEKNSQYGTIAIYNLTTFESATIKKDAQIPEGWAKGRFYNATSEELKQRKQLVDQIKALYPKSNASIRMKLDKLKAFLEIVRDPEKLHKLINPIDKKLVDIENAKKKLEKQQLLEKKIALLEEQYTFYAKHGWEETKTKYCYQFSQENFIQQCKRYVKAYVPQNGKKRGKQFQDASINANT